jgi:ferrous iron transport protein A
MLMQQSFTRRRRRRRHGAACLSELRPGEEGVLEHLDLPEDVSRRLMELGFVPGNPVVAAGCAPGGDPRVFRVDGSEIALRRETAARLRLRRGQPPAGD